MQELAEALRQATKELFDVEIEPELNRPEDKFGDCASNAALQLAGKLNKNPREIAEALASKLQSSDLVAKAEVAGPGFINITLKDEVLADMIQNSTDWPKANKGQEILVEFGDPNPFKEMHIGHLYSYIVGESISRLLEASGATVRRLSYHGDVGLHVARAIWGMQQAGVSPESTEQGAIGQYYAKGARAYEEDPEAKTQIEAINKSIYSKDDATINELYDWGKKQSFNEFDKVLNDLEIKIDRRYLESQSAATGQKLVEANIGKVFSKSAGAIVFEGEKVGLHTRVFITSQGLPTYETKDLGLAELKKEAYPDASKSVIITAHEQSEYFKVMLAALAEIDSQTAAITSHMYHGFVSLSTGKMSSRTGDVYSAASLISDVQGTANKVHADSGAEVYLAAVKYEFLRHRLGSDIVYDVSESVSLQGNSGPYLQYAHARACSILAKADQQSPQSADFDLQEDERSLASQISEYPEVVQKAVEELLPSHVTTYLYELAQEFNRFYEKNRVIGDSREALRLKLVGSYAQVLKNGLGLLNIAAPERL